jgi:hypothetical protein
MMKKAALCLMAIVTVSYAVNAQTKKNVVKPLAKPIAKSTTSTPLLKNSIDSFSYAVGLNIANSI